MESLSTTTKDDSKEAKISLPEDIVIDIISRLPVKSVFQSQCISKNFSSITSDPQFIDAHLRQSARLRPSIIVNKKDNIALVRCNSSLDSEITVEEITFHPDFDLSDPCVKNLEIVGSCNGLVLVAFGKYREKCYLWNIATLNRNSCTPIPDIDIHGRLPSWRVHDFDIMGVSYGFGYCKESMIYKIVRILTNRKINSLKFLVEVLAYEKDSAWRTLDFSELNAVCCGNGLTINGVVYWNLIIDKHKNRLLTFDLEKEEFGWTFCPMRMPFCTIMEFRGLLCGSKFEINKRTEGFDLWVLKDQSCWEKVFTTADFFNNMQPMQFLNDHCLLLNDLRHSCYLYDMECEELKKIPGLDMRTCNSIFHKFVESIVALHGPEDDFEYNSGGNDHDQNDDMENVGGMNKYATWMVEI